MGLIDKAQVISNVDTLIKSYTPKDGICKATNFMLLKIVCKVLDVVRNVPEVEAEPVVRCKECKYRGDYGCPMYYEETVEWDDDGYHEFEVVEHDHTLDDGFCDRGAKMDGKE